ncbi:MAG: TIR domain-containing protein [Chlorobiales bacterium]|nr:TIR domain-containing protein [Chlorobiales bacterium]
MTDIEILKKIEKKLKISLTEIDNLERMERGYTLNQQGQVTGLNLFHCSIQNLDRIISSLKSLTGLTFLDLSLNKLSDISPLSSLTGLAFLTLRYNRISDISPLKSLAGLTRLYLRNNQLSDISALQELKQLEGLDLEENHIVELPEWITGFDMEIHWEVGYSGGINLNDNPLKTPPPEIVKQGKSAIKNYFAQLREQEEDYLFEAKMLIVGEPGAGKTTMARKIENPDCALPKEEETTKGIHVKPYSFPLQEGDIPGFKHPEKLVGRNFRLNIWDFGGQDIYKATHRFFLTHRSLYALVADNRKEDTDFNYWLHTVELFGGASPLLIVLNEKEQRKRNLDRSGMQGRFTNIKDVVDVDFAEADKSRLSGLTKEIRFFATGLPHVGSPVPAKWTVVRDAIEHDPRNTISLQDYKAICEKSGITKWEDARVLSGYFHDIGVFLHFQEDELLNKTLFLKPNWATNAVYKILDHELLNSKNGRFNKEDAKTIWQDEQYEFVRDELLKLMHKFFLAYEIDKTGNYIVPERLPAAQPVCVLPETDNLFLRYKYDFFMPRGIMSQFIVQMHRYICNHDLVWRRGVVLEREGATAEVIETYDAKEIKIRIAGKNRRDFMTLIVEQLDKINGQYEKLKVEKLIPCNCSKCKTNLNPHFYEYQDLKTRLEKGKKDAECKISYDMVNVQGLIDDVINPEFAKREKVFISYSHKNKDWLERVQTQFKALRNLGIKIDVWDDTRIKSGMKWRDEIDKALATAKVAILLISTDFLASDFIKDNELPPLLKAAKNDGATILSVILEPCLFDMHKELSQFQTVNDPKKPLSGLTEHEQKDILADALARPVMELMK